MRGLPNQTTIIIFCLQIVSIVIIITVFIIQISVILICMQGDGLEFKRHFLKIRDKLQSIINRRVPAAMWPVLSSTPSCSNSALPSTAAINMACT